jgi:hypothetical protein
MRPTANICDECDETSSSVKVGNNFINWSFCARNYLLPWCLKETMKTLGEGNRVYNSGPLQFEALLRNVRKLTFANIVAYDAK